MSRMKTGKVMAGVLAAALGAGAGESATNLDFSNGPKDWIMDGRMWTVDPTAGRGGSPALVYDNADTNAYSFPFQRVGRARTASSRSPTRARPARRTTGRAVGSASARSLPRSATGRTSSCPIRVRRSSRRRRASSRAPGGTDAGLVKTLVVNKTRADVMGTVRLADGTSHVVDLKALGSVIR